MFVLNIGILILDIVWDLRFEVWNLEWEVIDEEKEKLRAHKTWYTSLYNKLFGGKHQK